MLFQSIFEEYKKLSIFKEYGVQYSNKMEESLWYIWHKKMQQASTHDFVIPQLQTLGMHILSLSFLWLS